MQTNPLKNIVKIQKNGKAVGIYSCCSANRYVIEAAIKAAVRDDSCVLIESTANQSDQYGGYTGMTPSAFKDFVLAIAKVQGMNINKLFLGGDHLGPLTFASKPEAEAMKEAEELIRVYVDAGFTKIHIDTSMKLASDDPNERLADEVIAARGARLAAVAEATFAEYAASHPGAVEPVYIVGSEVPIPGGAQGGVDEGLQVTKVADFKHTVASFKKAFEDLNLDHAWNNVIGVVVQPGVEEKDAGCTEYDRAKAAELCASIEAYPQLIFEGHSTDYQTKIKLKEMIEDGIAILKVGPGLTFAMREALFALAHIEAEVYYGTNQKLSNFIETLDAAMLKDPHYWNKHYVGTDLEIRLKRKYSFSDRCRYYMPQPEVDCAVKTLIANLRKSGVPLNLLSQFMPIQYTKVREGLIENDPEVLIVDRIINTIDEYLYATHQEQLF